MNDGQEKQTSRREFLRETIRKTGYILPTIVVIQMSTVDTWASDYAQRQNAAPESAGDKCNGFFEKIFDPKCW